MTSIKQPKRGPCLVCGVESIGVNFGVQTCMACKAFFRRNAVKLGSYDFICPRDGDCSVIHAHRRSCNCCRLAKCFRVGMQKDLILSEAEKEERRRMIEQSREKREQKPKMTSLALIRPSNLLRSTYNQSRSVSSSDQILLTNITGAYEQTCIALRNKTFKYFPSKPHSTIHSLLNDYTPRQVSVIDYFKLIPEFNQITIDDRMRLIKNHFASMLNLNEAGNLPYQYDDLLFTLRNVCGIELGSQVYRCVELLQAYRHDPILSKIVLVVQSLSGGTTYYRDERDMDRIYDNTKTIFAAQNIYTELLWRYIVSRSSCEDNAVKFFNKLILDLLVVVNVSFLTESFVFGNSEELEKVGPLLQSILPPAKKND